MLTEEKIGKLQESLRDLSAACSRVVIGQEKVIQQLLISLMSGGHALLEGVPGLGKSLLISTVAESINADFKRVQFTPDLMPGDITGTEILQETEKGERIFQFRKGPVFTNVLLADEINRTPPKTQAALLEAMQERTVSINGKSYQLPEAFFVLATQNPIEQSGTYPLPEAQLDRFLLFIKMGYPNEAAEIAVLEKTTGRIETAHSQKIELSELLEIQRLVREVYVEPQLLQKVARLIRDSRPESTTHDWVKEQLEYGAGTRAGQAILLTAKSHAFLNNRLSVTPEDIRAVSTAALYHRIVLNYRAESQGIKKEAIIAQLLKQYDLQ